MLRVLRVLLVLVLPQLVAFGLETYPGGCVLRRPKRESLSEKLAEGRRSS